MQIGLNEGVGFGRKKGKDEQLSRVGSCTTQVVGRVFKKVTEDLCDENTIHRFQHFFTQLILISPCHELFTVP